MKLNDEQRSAVRHPGNTLLEACPGSGKTRTIIAKLVRCLDEVQDTARKIACITYTTTAVYEIESRLRIYATAEDQDHCEISTIHAFCLNNILQYFHWRLPEYPNGFTVLPPDSERYGQIVAEVCQSHNLEARAREEFELLNVQPNGDPIVSQRLTVEAANDFWGRLRAEGLVDFPCIVYLSYRLLSQFPNLVHALACRFAWILVDEFQDTSALQIEILSLIAARKRTKFFVVGDPYQSIFGFAGARPELMAEFANRTGCKSDFKLLGNYRSSVPIIGNAERLCPRDPPIAAQGDAAVFTDEPALYHGDTAFNVITDYFLPTLDELKINYGDAAILSPTWFKLLPLGRQLRDYGIPVVGPGARPYRRTHLFALLAEQVCAWIEKPSPEFIPQIERELFSLLLNATGAPNYETFTYKGRRIVFRLLRLAQELRAEHEGAVAWLNATASAFSDALIGEEFLPRADQALLSESVTNMCADMQRNDVDLLNLTTADLGIFANPENNLKLLTMHRAKGREFDAVAIVDLHEGRIPHPAGSIDESRRLLYVAITRARRILFYITDAEHWQNRPSRFLRELGI